jgi:hypothetical protein
MKSLQDETENAELNEFAVEVHMHAEGAFGKLKRQKGRRSESRDSKIGQA